MPAKKPPPPDEKPQKQQLEEAAKKAGGVDADAFEKAMRQIASPKKPKR